jgi:peroxiredoxin
MAEKLGAGSAFPDMTLALVNGDSTTLPSDINGSYQVVLFYRGHW